MDALRQGWKRVKISQIVERHVERSCDIGDHTKFVGVDDLDTEDLRLRRYGVIGVDELPPTFRFVFRKDMILVPTRRPRLRKCAVAPSDGLTGEKILVLKPIVRSDLFPGFVRHLLSSPPLQQWNIEKEVGSVTPHFRWGDMAEFSFALPPLERQQRIANLLDAMQYLVESYGALLNTARYARLAWLKTTTKNLLSSESKIVPLGELLDGSPDSGCSAPERDRDTGYWVLGLSALTESGYVASEYKAVERTAAMLSARLLDGDLLITRSNTRERVGFAGRFIGDDREVSFPDTMMRLHPNNKKASAEWLELLLQSSPIRSAIQATAAGTSASMKKINRRNLLAVMVPDVPIAEQQLLVDALLALRETERKLEVRIKCLQRMRRVLATEVFQP